MISASIIKNRAGGAVSQGSWRTPKRRDARYRDGLIDLLVARVYEYLEIPVVVDQP